MVADPAVVAFASAALAAPYGRAFECHHVGGGAGCCRHRHAEGRRAGGAGRPQSTRSKKRHQQHSRCGNHSAQA